VAAHLEQAACASALISGCSRQSYSVAREIPVDMLMLRRLSPLAIRAAASRRTSALYIIAVWQSALTILADKFCVMRCPGWDSNPHFTVFEAARSAVGVPGRSSPRGERHDDNLPGDGSLVG
jgi:hypothetical protein